MRFLIWLAILAAVLQVFVLIAKTTPHDDTDPPDGRSGFILRIDNRTGCHYLGAVFGGYTPRLDAQGRHICERSN